MNDNTFNGVALKQPEEPPRRRFSMWHSHDPCIDHMVAYTGAIPCTGALRCRICGTEWDPDTGELIRVPRD